MSSAITLERPKKLTYYADILRYYRTLASKSPRVKVLDIGKTDEGRECVVVYVGSEDSIKNLDAARQNLAQLADPRKLSEADARAIIARENRSITSWAVCTALRRDPPKC